MAGLTQFSAVNLLPDVRVDQTRWNRIPTEEVVAETAYAVGKRGIRVIRAKDRQGALDTLTRLIPRGAEVMNGPSTTLIEIGYEALLKSEKTGWTDLPDKITAENDERMRALLRRKSVTADCFISGANAISLTGEIIACDLSGNRVGAWPFAAGHLILACGVNKIVPTLEDALRRVGEYLSPGRCPREKSLRDPEPDRQVRHPCTREDRGQGDPYPYKRISRILNCQGSICYAGKSP
jgi:L-lactate utilization protein LutB